MTDTRELATTLKMLAALPVSHRSNDEIDDAMTQAADTITALSERNRVLEEAVEAVIQFHNSTFTGPCAAQNKGRAWKGTLRKCLNARAALTSGGRG